VTQIEAVIENQVKETVIIVDNLDILLKIVESQEEMIIDVAAETIEIEDPEMIEEEETEIPVRLNVITAMNLVISPEIALDPLGKEVDVEVETAVIEEEMTIVEVDVMEEWKIKSVITVIEQVTLPETAPNQEEIMVEGVIEITTEEEDQAVVEVEVVGVEIGEMTEEEEDLPALEVDLGLTEGQDLDQIEDPDLDQIEEIITEIEIDLIDLLVGQM